MNIQELAELHQNDHPGYYLTDWYEAAFPTYVLQTRVAIMEKRPVPTVEEFIMRLLEAGVEDPGEMGKILGLSFEVVSSALLSLNMPGYIRIQAARLNGDRHETVAITDRGHLLLQELTLRQPTEETFPFCVDALTGDYFQYQRLFDAAYVRKNDLFLLPNDIEEPEIGTINANSLKRLWSDAKRLSNDDIKSTEFIGLSAIDSFLLGFRSFRVLQFADGDQGVTVHVYDRQDRSLRHEVKIMQLHQRGEGHSVLRLEKIPQGIAREIPNPMASFLDQATVASVQRKSQEIPILRQTVEEIEKKISDEEERVRNTGDRDSQHPDINVTELKQKREFQVEKLQELQRTPPETEILSMVEHRPKLLQALSEAEERLIIISPWLNLTAVNKELQQALRSTLWRGVEVLIGFGFGEDSYGQKQAIRALNQIREQMADKGRLLRLYRLEASHAKIVICDNKYVVLTSFNWLSFAGREDLGNRVEYGALLRDKNAVEQTTNYVFGLFENSAELLNALK